MVVAVFHALVFVVARTVISLNTLQWLWYLLPSQLMSSRVMMALGSIGKLLEIASL